jgi:hypothetical protein
MAEVGAANQAGWVDERVTYLDYHVAGGCDVHQGGLAGVALRQPDQHRDVVLGTLIDSNNNRQKRSSSSRESKGVCAGGQQSGQQSGQVCVAQRSESQQRTVLSSQLAVIDGNTRLGRERGCV